MSFLNRFLPQRPQDDTLASVARNLEHLLNSRREYGSLLCSFGLADYLAEQGGRNTVLTVLREIQDTIHIYEPRLRVLSLKCRGRDGLLRLHIDLQGMLLLPHDAMQCQILVLFHPISGAVTLALPPLALPGPPALTARSQPVPLNVLAAVSLVAQLGADVLLARQPELGPILVVAALAGLGGLLPEELVGPASEGGRATLESQPELAAGLVLIGLAVQAGLLPSRLTAAVKQAAKLATESNSEVAEAVAWTSVAPFALVEAAASGSGSTELARLASVAAERGLLPTAVAVAIAQSPRTALTTIPELASAVMVAKLATALGEPVPQAFPQEV